MQVHPCIPVGNKPVLPVLLYNELPPVLEQRLKQRQRARRAEQREAEEWSLEKRAETGEQRGEAALGAEQREAGQQP